MESLFNRTPPKGAPVVRSKGLVSIHLAVAIDGPNAVKPNRANRRRGVTYLYELAAKPARHTICKVCDKRTWTSRGGTCRKCFLAGEGDEVTYS